MSPSVGWLLAILAALPCPGGCGPTADSPSLAKQEALTLDTCSECRQVVRLSANMISSRDTKVTVYETLHALCRHLSGERATECVSQVKTYLPKVLQQTPGHLKPDETCGVFGLCAAHREEVLSGTELGTAATDHEQFNPACSLCLFVIKKLETLLPKNMTEETLMKILGEVCDLMPQSYKEQCDDFVSNYGVQIVEFLLSSAAPHTICTLLQICLFEEQAPRPEVAIPSDCESCRTLAVLSLVHLGSNSSQPQTSSFLNSVCALHPSAIPKCEAFTRVYGHRLQKVLLNQTDLQHACERADLCAASKSGPLGKRRCTGKPHC